MRFDCDDGKVEKIFSIGDSESCFEFYEFGRNKIFVQIKDNKTDKYVYDLLINTDSGQVSDFELDYKYDKSTNRMNMKTSPKKIMFTETDSLELLIDIITS